MWHLFDFCLCSGGLSIFHLELYEAQSGSPSLGLDPGALPPTATPNQLPRSTTPGPGPRDAGTGPGRGPAECVAPRPLTLGTGMERICRTDKW